MRKLIGNIILSILLLGQIAACQNKKTMTAEEEAKLDQEEINRPNEIWPTNKDAKGDYYYYVSLNSFPSSLAEDAGSAFITGKEHVGFLTMENDAWTTTTGAVLNDEYHPVPDSLYVRWFSISEDKFYEGRFKMPTQVIKEHFDEMWLTFGSARKKMRASKYERFKNLIVGVTPGGGVMVWMESTRQQIEIGHYQAREIQMDWNEFAGVNNFGDGSTRQQFIESQKNRITLPIPFGKAEKYREKFVWKCGVESNANIETISFQLYLLNGEVESIYGEYNSGLNEFKKRAAPAQLNFILQEANKKGYNFEILFDEDDLFKAFHTICADKKTEAKLVLVLDNNNKISKIVLRNKTQEYVLNPNKVDVYTGKYNSKITPIKDH
jgi:hypothetical protein